MPHETRIVAPGPHDRAVRTAGGETLIVPEGWELLPPGDAAMTRRVKAAGPAWVVQEKKGRRTFSRGVYAPAERITAIRAELARERSTESYGKRQASAAARREREQCEYVEMFRAAVIAFLSFAPRHAGLAERLADAVTQHVTPVGSGTVARTQRIPIEKRAESAVIAWLRHHTTAYDQMKIPRVKGSRREVRRMLAEQSRLLLDQYRAGGTVDGQTCVLSAALQKSGLRERRLLLD
jgi:hypothetical protein